MKASWNAYRGMLGLLPRQGRRYIATYSILLGVLAVLDAASLAILAVIITPLVSNQPINLPILGHVDGSGLLLLLGAVCALMVLKSGLSLTLIWFATRRFAQYELEIGNALLDSYLRSTWSHRLTKNSSDIVRIADVGVANAIAGFLLPGASLLGEALAFLTILGVLAVAQPAIALAAILYLGVVGVLMFFWITKRARVAGVVGMRSSLKVSRLLTEMVGALKEITLRDKVDEVSEVVRTNRVVTARARSNMQFLTYVPRYVLEAALIGGFVVVGLVGLWLGGVVTAVTGISLFALAGFRMTPSLQRFQNVTSQVVNNTALAQAVIADIQEAELVPVIEESGASATIGENPAVLALDKVGFQYQVGADEAVEGVTLAIPFGTSAAIVGASGAGKSTIVDLILGLLEPTSGRITIDGVDIAKLARSWRTRVGYVPQEVALFDGSVAQNVALTWTDDFDRDRVQDALKRAQLLDTILSRPDGIDGRIGERGMGLSGGQRQRLGIARALYGDPFVLVMDEATSSLDTATEAAVSDAIKALHGSVTTITVAHRLATIKHADQIFFMSGGRLEASGTFSELVASVPEFALQAGFAGLTGPSTDPT
jgi:ATP-binding cassette, subfamily B, bacterial PglK